jgi:hypothetical protein
VASRRIELMRMCPIWSISLGREHFNGKRDQRKATSEKTVARQEDN